MDDRILQIAAALHGQPAEERGRASPVFTREARARGSRESVNPTIMPPVWRQRMNLPRRSYNAPTPHMQQEPYGAFGPGAITGELPPLQGSVSDLARPMTFADYLTPQQPLPSELRDPGPPERVGPNTGGPIHGVEPLDAPYAVPPNSLDWQGDDLDAIWARAMARLQAHGPKARK